MTLVLIDDAKIVRDGLKKIIRLNCPQYQVIGEAADGEKGLELIKELLPDVCIIDMKMPKMNGIEMARKAKEVVPRVKFIVLSGYSDFHYAKSMIDYGCSAYLLKPVNHSELITILHTLAQKHEEENVTHKVVDVPSISPNTVNHQILNASLEMLYNGTFNKSDENLLPQQFIQIVKKNYSLGILHIDQQGMHIPTKGASLEYFGTLVTDSFNSILGKYPSLSGYCSIHNQSESIFILSRYDEIEVGSFVAEIQAAIKKNHGISLSASLSLPHEGLDSIGTALGEANDAYDQCFYDSWGSCRWLMPKKLPDNFPVFFQFEQQIFRNLSMENHRGAIVQINQLIATFIHYQVPKDQCLIVLNRIFKILLSVLIKQNHQILVDMLPTAELFEKQLTQCERIEDLKCSIVQIIKELDDYDAHIDETDPSRNRIIRKVLRYIDQNYENGLSLVEMSQVAHMAPSYFSAFFKKEIGENYLTFVTRMKMERAKELLQDGSIHIYEVSKQVGFEDSKYFSKQFHKFTGRTPKEFRDSIN